MSVREPVKRDIVPAVLKDSVDRVLGSLTIGKVRSTTDVSRCLWPQLTGYAFRYQHLEDR